MCGQHRTAGLTGVGIALPSGLRQADRLPEPIFTPSTKAALGGHDENIGFGQAVDLIGPELASRIRDLSLDIYRRSAAYALEHGIIIADTKFEFGLDDDGRLHLIDEVLTPDSSRFWPVDAYRPGSSPPSFDKQFVRDYLETIDWDKTPPGPELPDDIIARTAAKYAEAEARLTRGLRRGRADAARGELTAAAVRSRPTAANAQRRRSRGRRVRWILHWAGLDSEVEGRQSGET